ncbi:MAG: nitroreductase [Armatimonadota bacterium]|nr:nitroreductase [Armatimonadota bacterium]
MEALEAIRTRRSVRAYLPRPVERAHLEQLIDAARLAPSAMNTQPWAFGVLQGIENVRQYGARAKAHLLSHLHQFPALERYRERLTDPAFEIFYGAPALVLIYARQRGARAEADCNLAAQNLMLAAHALGLGTCWIGFAHTFFDLPETKAELGAPGEAVLVAPIVVGYPAGPTPAREKNPPVVYFWR